MRIHSYNKVSQLLLLTAAQCLQASEAKQILINALADVWPGNTFTEVFLRAATHICLHIGFAMGLQVPYELITVSIRNLLTHLHRHGVGMVPSTVRATLALPEVQPFFKPALPTNKEPEHVLLHIANVYNGHLSALLSDIVQQTYSVEPGCEGHVQYKPNYMAPALRAASAVHTAPAAAPANTNSSHAAASPAGVAAVPKDDEYRAPVPTDSAALTVRSSC